MKKEKLKIELPGHEGIIILDGSSMMVHGCEMPESVDIIPISETRSVIKCQYCGMRIIIPIEIKTFEKLYDYFEKRKEETIKSFKYPPLG